MAERYTGSGRTAADGPEALIGAARLTVCFWLRIQPVNATYLELRGGENRFRGTTTACPVGELREGQIFAQL